MKVHLLQHVRFEGPGAIALWAHERGYEFSAVPVFEGADFPEPVPGDLLVSLGGPMSVHDAGKYSWINAERRLMLSALDAGTKVFGICLGAQLLAAALGASVAKSPEKEVGWQPVRRSGPSGASFAHEILPEVFEALHWHGEMFQIPDGALRLAESEGCPNQGFAVGREALGLQFHLEMLVEGVPALCEACPEDLRPARFVQPQAEILARPERFANAHNLLFAVLDALCSK